MVAGQTTFTNGEGTITKAFKNMTSYNKHGVNVAKKWVEQRIRNEATALQFIKENTAIPVPAVSDVGEGKDGYYLTMEFFDSIPLDEIGDRCHMPSKPDHTARNCERCRQLAGVNAAKFVQGVLSPELERLRSTQTGLSGTIIPPPWIIEHDRREEWTVKESCTPDFVFHHGDFGPHNVMMNSKTLKVLCVFDWENAGYYPRDFFVFPLTMEEYYDFYKDTARVEKYVSLIE
ncbi:hypothetical protein ACEPPN_006415 [Leptodophora sp. 'Broadleaf-Isolate-01']